MNLEGILIGIFSFFIIGLFHPIVIKCEYHFSYKIWWLFLVLGAIFIILSIMVNTTIISAILSVTGFTCWWTIKELFEQRERVKKGWYPKKDGK